MCILKNKPLFLLFLPLFFVFHGFTEFFPLIPVKDSILLFLFYLSVTFLLTLASYLFLRDWIKAALCTALLAGYYFFFGAFHDTIKDVAPGTLISRYLFILPVSLLLVGVIILFIKKRKRSFSGIVPYLNYLFLFFLAIDIFSFIPDNREKRVSKSSYQAANCDNCKKPDIFFIVLDGYAGHRSLKERMNFDNSDFESSLKQIGFDVIPDGRSNYNYTPFSIASMLNMKYLDLDMKAKGSGNLNYCYQMIRSNHLFKILRANGYDCYNYSSFDMESQPAPVASNFMPIKTRLITSRTLSSRIIQSVRDDVAAGRLKIPVIEKKIVYSHLQNNELFTRLTIETLKHSTGSPKFIYTHLMMPHYPYYFNSLGDALPYDSLVEGKQYNMHNYVEYLQYCNIKIRGLVDTLINNSSSPPIIILSGDHGFRYFPDKKDREYIFNNLLAVNMPSKVPSAFYTGFSAVNLFPVILNSQLGQRIPLQKDSTVFLWD